MKEVKEEQEALSEINVTPLVDVMLVLLTIFMITAPLMKATLDVELPSSEGKIVEVRDEKSVTVKITRNGDVFLNGNKIEEENLLGTFKNLRDRDVYVEGDRRTSYEKIIYVLDILRKAGVRSVSLITELKKE